MIRSTSHRLVRILSRARNPILVEFRHTWDGSLAGVELARESIPDRPEPSSIRDEAADFLADLAHALGRSR